MGVKNIGMVIIAHDKFGGLERRFARLAQFLPNVLLFANQDAITELQRQGIAIPANRLFVLPGHATDVGFRKAMSRIQALFALLVRHRTKVDHFHLVMNPGYFPSIYSLLAPKKPTFSIPIVNYNLKFTNLALRLSTRRAKFVDCLSETIQERALERLRTRKVDQFLVAPCSFTDYSKVAKNVKRDIDVCTMSRFVPGKGIEMFVQALEKLPPMEAHICGYGSLDVQTTRARVYDTTEPFGVLGRTKIFLSLQTIENYPSQSLLEAMASGCAIIATDVGETRRMLDERCAVFVSPGDTKGLKAAIMLLLKDPERREQMGTVARERATNEHTIERYASYFLGAVNQT